MYAIVENLAQYGIMAVIGVVVLGVVVWLVTSMVNFKSRQGRPDSGGWKPPGRR